MANIRIVWPCQYFDDRGGLAATVGKLRYGQMLNGVTLEDVSVKRIGLNSQQVSYQGITGRF